MIIALDTNSKSGMEMGWSPGLVVKGGDLYSEGCEFESQSRILDGHFSYLLVLIIVKFVEKTKINEKEVEFGPFV